MLAAVYPSPTSRRIALVSVIRRRFFGDVLARLEASMFRLGPNHISHVLSLQDFCVLVEGFGKLRLRPLGYRQRISALFGFTGSQEDYSPLINYDIGQASDTHPCKYFFEQV